MNKGIWMMIALISGAILPLQAGLNSKLAKVIGNPVYASLISFIIGTISIAGFILLTRQSLSIAALRSAPVHLWLGGLLGAVYVTAIVFVFPKVGPALTFGLIVAGQMVLALLMDHYKIMVEVAQPVNVYRILGMVMIVGGVILIRKF